MSEGKVRRTNKVEDIYTDDAIAYGQFMDQEATMVTSGGFYLAFAGADTRGDGNRFIWGTSTSNNVRFNQIRNRMHITIDGNNTRLSPDLSIPNTWVLLPAKGVLAAWFAVLDQKSNDIGGEKANL